MIYNSWSICSRFELSSFYLDKIICSSSAYIFLFLLLTVSTEKMSILFKSWSTKLTSIFKECILCEIIDSYSIWNNFLSRQMKRSILSFISISGRTSDRWCFKKPGYNLMLKLFSFKNTDFWSVLSWYSKSTS